MMKLELRPELSSEFWKDSSNCNMLEKKKKVYLNVFTHPENRMSLGVLAKVRLKEGFHGGAGNG